MNLHEGEGSHAPDTSLIRQKQAVPLDHSLNTPGRGKDDPRSNDFVTGGNNQKAELDASKKPDGRTNTLKTNSKPGLLPGDKKPKLVPHGTGSGAIAPATLEMPTDSPSNKVPDPMGPKPKMTRKDEPSMAKPPSGNPSAGAVPQAKTGMAKGLGGIVAGAHNGAMEGMQSANHQSAGNAQSVVIGGALGALKGAISAARGPAAGIQKADIGTMKGSALQAAHAAAPGAAPAAKPVKLPTPDEHAQRAQSFQDFMPSAATAGHQPTAGASKPAGTVAPVAGAKPMLTSTLKPPTTGIAKPMAAPGGALGHLPKLTGVLNRPKGGPAAGAVPQPATVQAPKPPAAPQPKMSGAPPAGKPPQQ
jgi:hypothetical protein